MSIASNDPDEPETIVHLIANAFAVNELHAGNMNVFSGDTGSMVFTINNMEPFSSFQFDMYLPEPMIYLEGSENLSARSSGHIVT